MGTTSLIERADEDAILPVTIGTALWAALLVILVLQRPTLAANGASWWLGVAAVGVVSGAAGIVFLVWRRRRIDRRASGVTEV